MGHATHAGVEDDVVDRAHQRALSVACVCWCTPRTSPKSSVAHGHPLLGWPGASRQRFSYLYCQSAVTHPISAGVPRPIMINENHCTASHEAQIAKWIGGYCRDFPTDQRPAGARAGEARRGHREGVSRTGATSARGNVTRTRASTQRWPVIGGLPPL
jgi:hypothetical protein